MFYTYDNLNHHMFYNQEEDDLSDAFKSRLGLGGLDGIAETKEISIAVDWEKDATISTFKFSKYAKQHYIANNTHKWQNTPLKEPLLQKSNDIDRIVCSLQLRKQFAKI